jgi:hypothetical protein
VAEDRLRIEIGFDGGQVLSTYVQVSAADGLEQVLGAGTATTVQLEAEDGQYTIAISKIVYVKRYSREGRVGFSGG